MKTPSEEPKFGRLNRSTYDTDMMVLVGHDPVPRMARRLRRLAAELEAGEIELGRGDRVRVSVDRVRVSIDRNPGQMKSNESPRKGVTQAMSLQSSQIKQMRWMKDNLTNQMDAPEWDWLSK